MQFCDTPQVIVSQLISCRNCLQCPLVKSPSLRLQLGLQLFQVNHRDCRHDQRLARQLRIACRNLSWWLGHLNFSLRYGPFTAGPRTGPRRGMSCTWPVSFRECSLHAFSVYENAHQTSCGCPAGNQSSQLSSCSFATSFTGYP